MIDRISQSPPFYILVILLIPVATTLNFIPPIGVNAQLNFVYTAMVSILFFFAFILWEEFLSIEIRTPLVRRVLTILLLLGASVPSSLLFLAIEINVEFLLLLCVCPAFLNGVQRVFYQNHGSLFTCTLPGILMALLEPLLLIPQTLLCLMLFPQEKERSFFLFTALTVPVIFLQINQFELTNSWVSAEFVNAQSKILEAPFHQTPEILVSQSLGFMTSPVFLILYLFLWTYIVFVPSCTGLKQNIAWASFVALPTCSLLEGGTIKPPLDGVLVVLIMFLVVVEFTSIKNWFVNTLNTSAKVFFIIGLLCLAYPFYQRMMGNQQVEVLSYEGALP